MALTIEKYQAALAAYDEAKQAALGCQESRVKAEAALLFTREALAQATEAHKHAEDVVGLATYGLNACHAALDADLRARTAAGTRVRAIIDH